MMISGRRCVTLCWTFCQLLGCLSAKSIVATVGKDVTLPCKYDAEDHGRHPACWGRGAVSLWDCADEVIKAGRTTVTSRLLQRYLLLGDLDKGDVSLTIRQLEESDSGVYSCRVEIPGWFNDHTHELTLMVVPAPPNPLKLETREVHKRTITVHWTPLFDGGRPITSYTIYMKHKLASWETAVINHVLNPDQTRSTFAGLHPAETYNFCMFAFNSVGRSNASNVLTITTKEAAPEGPPLDIQLKALSSHSIQVTWKPPRADLRNGVLLGYSIGYREYDPANRQIKKWQYQSVRATREVESVMLNHLKPSTVYSVFIQARTNAGVGPVTTDLCSTLSQATVESSFPLSPGATSEVKTPSGAVWEQITTSFTSELIESVEEGVPELFSVGSLPTLEKIIDFIGVGNIVRMGVVASIVILIFFFIFRCVSTLEVIATVGTDATLSCSYDAQYYGRLSVCWGRGAIPNSGCADEVIKSDGTSVTSRLSERYQLMGDLGSGDVTLTITQVEESDSGMYGCRVEIPGWFNDQKQQLTLTVVAVRPNPLKVEPREVKERTVTVRWTPGFDGGRPITSYRVDLKNKQASWDTAVRTEVSNPALTQVTVVDLRPAKTYNLRMFAVNSLGVSAPSNVLTVTTKEAAPEGPPLDMHLEALSPHSIKVTWKPPRADLRNGVLRSYSISYREYDPTGNQYKKWQHQSVTATREVESVILHNLKPSAKYGVLVQAKTNAGIGPAATAPFCSTLDEVHITSTASLIKSNTPGATVWIQDTPSFTSVHTTLTVEPVTAATDWGQTTSMISVPPDPPVVKLKEVIDNTISLCWTPGFEGDSPITGYYLEYKATNASWDYTKTVVDFSSNETEATIIEINPSTYNIRMFAKNSLGTSRASNVLTITTGETGHQRDNLVTATPIDIHDTARVEVDEARHDIHLAAIVVPVVLVVLIVATAITWHLQRIKQKQGNMNMWGNNRAVHYRGSELLQEL